jgi:hypothetical protein
MKITVLLICELLSLFTRWYRTRRPIHCEYCVFPCEFYTFLIHPPELSGSDQQRQLVAKQKKLG